MKQNKHSINKKTVAFFFSFLVVTSGFCQENNGLLKSPLLVAVSSGNEKALADALLKTDVNYEIAENPELVFFSDNAKILHLIVQAGFSEFIVDKWGSGLIHAACQNGKLDIVQHMLEIGVDVNTKDYTGRTPLYISCGNTSTDIAKLLLERGAYVDAQTSKGVTCVMECIREGNVGVLQLLIKRNPNLRLVDSDGKCAMDYFSLEKRSYVEDGEFDKMKNMLSEALKRSAKQGK